MMQDPDRLDQVEAAVVMRQQVRLGIFDRQAIFAGLAGRVSQARQAEINRRCPRAGKSLRGFNGIAARATAGNQDVVARCKSGIGKFLLQPGTQTLRRRGAGNDPARVGILFILRLDGQRDGVADRLQAGNGCAKRQLFHRLAQLLGKNSFHRIRPAPNQQAGKV